MKKTLLLFVTLLTVTLTNAQLVLGDTFEQGIFKYQVTTAEEAGSPNTVSLTGTVDGATIPDALVIPATVTEGGIEYAITLIGNRAFWKATMTSLVIEGNATLDSQSFRACPNLKTVDLPLVANIGIPPAIEGGNEIGLVFWQSTALETINMPQMENIYVGAFNGCSSLKEITFPSTVTYISSANQNMFKGCNNLAKVKVEYTTFIELIKIEDGNISIFNDPINNANATLSVPEGTLSTYQAADVWKDFNSITLGVNSPEKITLGSYPNPVVDFLHFSSNDVYSVDIYNILGARVSSQKVVNDVDMTNLKKGVYIVKAKNDKGLNISSIKVIKQ
ncbi:Por secretion system C-terminal sorting domain-containing protein [Polaribacter sp. KT25b]|uniref:leucine-rich repeat domain-containing protein n=1 Tax=Polaribacter sp. KT25b TaxID=1855336 RepID=UPI00087A78D1|nr:leucine-rich repeat domain-containing protein [Polaribacter sp. KT25b]SDR65483.1 Por secretion system C-terminal sorting domain-containing protein [Polaribacter sp. KT25b]